MSCWSCAGPTPTDLTCATCGALAERLPPNAFDLFALPEGVTVDRAALDKAYFAAARVLHADRFSTKTLREQTLALAHTATLNDAYATLKDDVRRAQYLLTLRGQPPLGSNDTAPAHLLAESFEFHETLAGAGAGQLAHLADGLAARKAACLQGLAADLAAARLAQARERVMELKFLQTCAAELAQRRSGDAHAHH
jgi:molecular chaperone HscB